MLQIETRQKSQSRGVLGIDLQRAGQCLLKLFDPLEAQADGGEQRLNLRVGRTQFSRADEMAARFLRTVHLELQVRQGHVQLSTLRGNIGRPFQMVACCGNVAAIETVLGQFNEALRKVVVAV